MKKNESKLPPKSFKEIPSALGLLHELVQELFTNSPLLRRWNEAKGIRNGKGPESFS